MRYLTLLALLFYAKCVFACPLVGDLVDVNCDGQIQILITGDSVVAGIGDEPANRGGYVSRLSRQFKNIATINSLGVPGITSSALLSKFKRGLAPARNGKIRQALAVADLVIIDVGRNDYWSLRKPELTVRNIKRLSGYIRAQSQTLWGIAPSIEVNTLLPTRRTFQQPFLTEVNALLLKQSSNTFPVRVRSDLVDTKLISLDGLHPSKLGYNVIASKVRQYIRVFWAPDFANAS